ncbi:electron transport complex subunit RsxC, partial [Pseudoalteromonas sp. S1608]
AVDKKAAVAAAIARAKAKKAAQADELAKQSENTEPQINDESSEGSQQTAQEKKKAAVAAAIARAKAKKQQKEGNDQS